MSSELQQEIIDEYLAECEEILQRVTSGLALLERSEHDGETLNSIYRDMHTFKGSSMLFGFANAGEVAHVMEASLDPLRKSDLGLQLSSKFINIQFQCVDLLEKYLDGIRNGDFKGEVLNPQKIQLIGTVVDIASTEFGRAFDVSKPQFSEDLSTEKEYLKSEGYLLDSENPTEQEGAVARLAESALIEPAADSSSTFETDAKSAITAALSEALSNVSGIDDRRKEVDELFSEEAAKEAALAAVESARLAATEVLKDLDSGIEDIRSEIDELFAEEQFALEQKTAEMENQKAFESKKVVSIETSESKHITQNMVEAKTNGANVMSEDEKDAHHLKSPAKDVTIRVSVDLLDRLMNLVGELVLVRNQVSQYSLSYDDMEFTNLSQNLDVVTSDIQGEIMKTRMQPIGNVLNKYIRIVRDIASDLSKKIKLELVGVETELDKTLLEAIRDPLTHIIRNCCDHGIEPPQERAASGKSEEGNILIRAFHEGGQVVVQIIDDGRGIQKNKVAKKALERGVITEEKLAAMSDKDIFGLIMMPGFSTAEKVSSVSGRGVGMDVVKTNIEAIGGNVEISSVEGKGTELSMKIPLTLAIVPAMLVKMKKDIFAIPQVLLAELVRVEPTNNGQSGLELLQGRPIYRLRGDLLPLVSLSEVLSGKSMSHDDIDSMLQMTVNIVVLNSEGVYFGLIVEEILDTADIVVKPISQFLKSLNVFSGATILGDGTVALILDIAGISDRVELSGSIEGGFSVGEPAVNSSMAQEFLTFSINQANTYAIPLCLVNRLEKFSLEEIEYSGEQRIVQYRNSILPIISLSDEMKFQRKEESSHQRDDSVNVIVVQKSGKFFGLEVDNIEDVVVIEESINEDVSDRIGVMGNVIFQEEVIVVVDVLMILSAIIERTSKSKGLNLVDVDAAKPVNYRHGKRILLAEDTPFFRRKIKSVLEKAGFEVVATENGQEAYEHLKVDGGKRIDILLSDIEMPVLDGFELATKVREESQFEKLPLIAITTRFRDRDIQRGKEVGFNAYLEKLNEEELLKNIDMFLPKGA